MAGQQRFWCRNRTILYIYARDMYGSKLNGYRTVSTFRTAFMFIDRNLNPQKIKKTPKKERLFNTPGTSSDIYQRLYC